MLTKVAEGVLVHGSAFCQSNAVVVQGGDGVLLVDAVLALRDGQEPSDPRVGPSAEPGWEWVSDVHAGQLTRLRNAT